MLEMTRLIANVKLINIMIIVIGKLRTTLSKEEDWEGRTPMSLKGVKGCLIAHLADGSINLYNLTQIHADKSPSPVLYRPFKAKQLTTSFVPLIEQMRTSQSNNYFLIKNPYNSSEVVYYEAMVPFIKPDNGLFDILNMKFPM